MYHQTENQLGNVRPKLNVVFSGSKRWGPRDVSAGLGRGVHLGVSLCRVKAAGRQRKGLQLQRGAQPVLWGALEPGWALRSPLHQGGRGAGIHSPTHRPAFVCGPPDPAGSVTQGRKPLLSAEGSSWLESVAESCAANTPRGQGNSCTGQGLSTTTMHPLCCSENGVTVMLTFTELLEQYKVHLQAMHIWFQQRETTKKYHQKSQSWRTDLRDPFGFAHAKTRRVATWLICTWMSISAIFAITTHPLFSFYSTEAQWKVD